jgi:beta-amylase
MLLSAAYGHYQIYSRCLLVDPVHTELRHLKSLNVDGFVVGCWREIVEAWTLRKHELSGYMDI